MLNLYKNIGTKTIYQIRILILLVFVSYIGCTTDNATSEITIRAQDDTDILFHEKKWKMKEGSDYPFRDKMLNDVVYNDTIRALYKDEILDLLGEPDKINENHFYYLISKKQIGFWTLHSKTMVIKFFEDDSIEWIKIHE